MCSRPCVFPLIDMVHCAVPVLSCHFSWYIFCANIVIGIGPLVSVCSGHQTLKLIANLFLFVNKLFITSQYFFSKNCPFDGFLNSVS